MGYLGKEVCVADHLWCSSSRTVQCRSLVDLKCYEDNSYKWPSCSCLQHEHCLLGLKHEIVIHATTFIMHMHRHKCVPVNFRLTCDSCYGHWVWANHLTGPIYCRFLLYELLLYILWLVSFMTFSLLFESEVS